MKPRYLVLFLSLGSCLGLASCSNPRVLPTTRPLFVGFDDSRLDGDKRVAIERAKVDFQRARRGEAPVYARYAHTRPYSRSQVHAGQGYEITMVDEAALHGHVCGPMVVLKPDLTGGKPFSYDEVINIMD